MSRCDATLFMNPLISYLIGIISRHRLKLTSLHFLLQILNLLNDLLELRIVCYSSNVLYNRPLSVAEIESRCILGAFI